MLKPPTPAKASLRARYKELEKFARTLQVNSENATFVANAFFWHTGMKNRNEIKAVVDSYMEHMKLKVAESKQEKSLTVIDGFIDQTLLDKVKEFENDSSYVEPE